MTSTNAPSKFTVAILPLGDVSDWHIKLTIGVLEQEFGVHVLILPARELPTEYLDTKNKLYKNRHILNLLLRMLPAEARCIMGIIAGGLQDENGERQLACAYTNNKAAVCSVLPAAEWDLVVLNGGQVESDAICYHAIAHEFCHILGLPHCSNPSCVMHEAFSEITMCTACRWCAAQKLTNLT